jgi:hypothetical protein
LKGCFFVYVKAIVFCIFTNIYAHAHMHISFWISYYLQ